MSDEYEQKTRTILPRLQECFVVLVGGEEGADCSLNERGFSTSSTANDGDIYQL